MNRDAGKGSTPSRIRRAQEKRHAAEREPGRALDIITAELMAIDEPMGRQFFGDGLAVIAADVLWHWQADVGESGYPDGLRGFTVAYVRRVDGLYPPRSAGDGDES